MGEHPNLNGAQNQREKLQKSEGRASCNQVPWGREGRLILKDRGSCSQHRCEVKFRQWPWQQGCWALTSVSLSMKLSCDQGVMKIKLDTLRKMLHAVPGMSQALKHINQDQQKDYRVATLMPILTMTPANHYRWPHFAKTKRMPRAIAGPGAQSWW